MNKPITLCDRCDIEASCLLNYDGVPCRKNRTVEPTNADRIRAMTDDELVRYLEVLGVECPPGYTNLFTQNCVVKNGYGCITCWLDWLRQEATDADN